MKKMKNEKDILLERAKKTAVRKHIFNQVSEDSISVIEFLLMPERYAFEDKYVSEVLTLKEITTIPGTPSFVMGVINLRGRIVSVVNLKNLFNLKERGLTELNKVIILKNDKMEFGIVTDSILGNKSINISEVSLPPLTLDKIGSEYVSGVTTDGLILLKADNLLSSKQIILSK